MSRGCWKFDQEDKGERTHEMRISECVVKTESDEFQEIADRFRVRKESIEIPCRVYTFYVFSRKFTFL